MQKSCEMRTKRILSHSNEKHFMRFGNYAGTVVKLNGLKWQISVASKVKNKFADHVIEITVLN